MIEIPMATIQGEYSLPFHEKDYTVQGITFAGLMDPTLAAGQRMFKIYDEE